MPELPLNVRREKTRDVRPSKTSTGSVSATSDGIVTLDGEHAMTKEWIAFISVLLVSGSVAAADNWASKFKILDADGSGSVSRTEFEENVSKLKLDPAPTFTAVDVDNNNSLDPDEWAAAEKMTNAYNTPCRSSTSSWCPKD